MAIGTIQDKNADATMLAAREYIDDAGKRLAEGETE